MPAEIDSGGWLDAALKGVWVVVTALFGWIWRTSRNQEQMRQRMAEGEQRLIKIERGVGRILNHLTGTELHED